jgi:4-amino-4-deoxy-L-arabinose transferase-like glycosyltransferase
MNSNGMTLSGVLWLGAIAVVAMLFYRLGAHPLMETSDARYSEIAWEMVDSGDWLTPRMNGAIHLDKPPLAYWAGATGLTLFGHSERAVRLPLAIGATATLLLVLYLGWWLFGGRAGLLALLLLGTAPLFVFMARLFTTDLYLTLWVVAAYVAFFRGYAAPEPRRRWAIAFAAALALGMLTKGPVVLLHTLVPILPYHFLWGERGRLRPFFSRPAIATFVVIIAPWFLLVWAQHPGLWGFYFNQELVGRVTGEALGRRQPFYYFFQIILGGFLPWIFWLPFLVRRTDAAIDRQPPVPNADRLLLLWAIVPFVILSIIRSKLPPYLLPLIPALALWAGLRLDRRLGDERPPFPKASIAFATLAALVAIAGAVAIVQQHHRWHAETVPALAISLAVLVAGLAAFALSWRGSSRATTFVALLWVALALNLAGIHFLPNAKAKYRYFPLAHQLVEELAPDDAVVTYRWYLRGLPFYLGRTVTIADYPRFPHPLDPSPDLDGHDLQGDEAVTDFFTRDQRIWVIASDDDLAHLQEIAQIPLYEVGRNEQFRLLCNRPPEEPPPPQEEGVSPAG